jgi:hypothetical protein
LAKDATTEMHGHEKNTGVRRDFSLNETLYSADFNVDRPSLPFDQMKKLKLS